jgi:hypothetical protein
MLRGGSSPYFQEHASACLCNLARGGNAAVIAATGAIPELVRLLGPDVYTGAQCNASGALALLALYAPELAAPIAAAGAIPPLVEVLLSADSHSGMMNAFMALFFLACRDFAVARIMASAGFVPAWIAVVAVTKVTIATGIIAGVGFVMELVGRLLGMAGRLVRLLAGVLGRVFAGSQRQQGHRSTQRRLAD